MASSSEYQQTSIIDTLRRTDFARLARGQETYVDYMGGAIYPESLVKMHSDFLTCNILGNTHSVSNRYVLTLIDNPPLVIRWKLTRIYSSMLSLQYADKARDAVLKHFGASSEYAVVFASNASGALKLVGESFPFADGGKLVIGVDSHNSVCSSKSNVCHWCADAQARCRYTASENSHRTRAQRLCTSLRQIKGVLIFRRPRQAPSEEVGFSMCFIDHFHFTLIRTSCFGIDTLLMMALDRRKVYSC